MMTRTHALGAAAALAVLLPSVAVAQTAYSTADVNMRAGPSTQFPVVTTIPEDRSVTIHGCLDDFEWCDVSWRDRRGWVFAEFLGYPQGNRRVSVIEYGPRVDLPVISFQFGAYWDRHYRSEPWYSDRRRYGWRSDQRWREGRRGYDPDWDARRGDWREGRRGGDRDGWRGRDDDWRDGRRVDRDWRDDRDRRRGDWRDGRDRDGDRRDARRGGRDRDDDRRDARRGGPDRDDDRRDARRGGPDRDDDRRDARRGGQDQDDATRRDPMTGEGERSDNGRSFGQGGSRQDTPQRRSGKGADAGGSSAATPKKGQED